MESSNHSISPVVDSFQPQNHPSAPPQPETLVQEGFNLRSQLFRKNPRTFLPFKQRKMPPRAKEWIGHLGDVPIPPRSDDIESMGMLEQDWGIKANHRGSCPTLHTLFVNGKAQSAWEPMPEEALVEYLETIAKIPYSFPDIVEEYLPGVFDPIRADRCPDTTGPPPPSPRWYPKPILVAACVFAERRILADPRTTEPGSDDDSDEDCDDDSDDGEAYPNIVGAYLHNRFSAWDRSDTESISSCARSISPDVVGWHSSAASDDSSDGDDSDTASTCSECSDCSYYSDLDSVSSCTEDSDSRPHIKPACPEDPDCESVGAESDSDDDASEWDVRSITLDFQEAMHELERRGLELHSEI